MVKEVVPLPKHVFTVFEVAFHQLYPSVCAWVLKSNHSKTSCPWNVVLVDPNFTDVDLTPVFNIDSNAVWNHVSERLELDFT